MKKKYLRWAGEFQQEFVNGGKSVDDATDIEDVDIFDFYADGYNPHEAVKLYLSKIKHNK